MLAPGRDYIAWDEGEAYIARAAAVLPVLRQAIARDPAAAVSLALHALRGVWAVVEVADDSDGVIGDFCASVGASFVAALQAAPDSSSGFGDVYLALRLDEPFRAFDAPTAEAAMGPAALGHYRQSLRARRRRRTTPGLRAARPTDRRHGARLSTPSSGSLSSNWSRPATSTKRWRSFGRT